MTALSIRGLSVALPAGAERALAVEVVDLDVARGDIVCLVGESGSGKSVIAQAVMGLLPAALPIAGGSIMVDGEDIARAPEGRLRALRGARMSMVFQEPMTALNPAMRCGDQVDEALAVHAALPGSERARRVQAALAEVGLSDPARIAASYPHQVSGGERQRVMIAMALVNAPALLVADEPTTALDVTTQAQVLALIRRLARERDAGVLLITHDFGVVADVADRVVVLQQGRVVEQGSRDAVLESPREAYTRMLLDAVPRLEPPAVAAATAAATATATATAAAGTPVVAVRGLAKRWRSRGLTRWFARGRDVAALDGVDLELARGEVLGLVGESGSGKSTLVRCIARLTAPSAGRIELDGADVTHLGAAALRPRRRALQVVFQDPYRSLDPRLTAGESIIEGPLNYGVTRDEALSRARALLAEVGLDAGALARYPHQFSGGQRQRLCIARALALEPDVLVADEPLSALDVSVQARVIELLRGIRARRGLAMLLVTHDLRVAAQLCDRIAVMQRGRIVETGICAEVFAHPRHPWTRALLEAVPGRALSTREARTT